MNGNKMIPLKYKDQRLVPQYQAVQRREQPLPENRTVAGRRRND